jgi:hypoxanthine-guanine phosphoribosyltransferase
MLSNKEVTRVYETMLKSAWMKEQVKISLKISRRDILLLTQIVEKGLGAEDVKGFIPDDAAAAIRSMSEEMLSKAELSELKEIPVK